MRRKKEERGGGAGARQDKTKQAHGERKKDVNCIAVHGMQWKELVCSIYTLDRSVLADLWVMQEVL